MESSKSIRQNMLMNMALTVSNLLFPLITYSYVARILLSQGTGRVAFVQSVLTYFSYLASLGIGGYATRECARVRHDRYQLSVVAGEIWKIQRITTVVSCAALAITVLAVPRFRREGYGGYSGGRSAAERRAQREQRKYYRFFVCPHCSQKVRVPKGKRKIEITCPKCRTSFIRKT